MTKRNPVFDEIERRANEILIAMVGESWNESLKRIAGMLREREELRRKNETLTYRATVFADTAWEVKYEAGRKITEAAVAAHIAAGAYYKISAIEPIDYDAKAELAVALDEADAALRNAIIEYRAYIECGAIPFSPRLAATEETNAALKQIAVEECPKADA